MGFPIHNIKHLTKEGSNGRDVRKLFNNYGQYFKYDIIVTSKILKPCKIYN